MLDVTSVAQAIIAVVVAVVAYIIVPLIRDRVGADKFAEITAWVKIAVDAAEQIFSGPGRGAEKKAYVVTYLEGKGFHIDGESLDLMIEAAVLELNQAVGISK